jgi:hypothetical protein
MIAEGNGPRGPHPQYISMLIRQAVVNSSHGTPPPRRPGVVILTSRRLDDCNRNAERRPTTKGFEGKSYVESLPAASDASGNVDESGASQKRWRREGFQVMLSEAKHPNPPEDSSLRSE